MAETNSAIVSLPSLVSSPVRQTGAALYRENEILPDWINVLKWSLVLIGAFTVYHSIEKFVVHASHPFIYNPAEFSCRVVGLSHYTIGLIFMLTARRMRKVAAWAWLAGLGAVGIMLCVFFYDF